MLAEESVVPRAHASRKTILIFELVPMSVLTIWAFLIQLLASRHTNLSVQALKYNN
jgi:hypothetical protein